MRLSWRSCSPPFRAMPRLCSTLAIGSVSSARGTNELGSRLGGVEQRARVKWERVDPPGAELARGSMCLNAG